MISIFLIDDHKLFTDSLKTAFQQSEDCINLIGTASSGKSACKQIKDINPDVILLDLCMPEMNGIECFKHIKEHLPNVKVIALTGVLDSNILYEAWMIGMDAIVPKSCGLDTLVKAIKQVLTGQRFVDKELPNFFKNVSVIVENQKFKLSAREIQVLNLLSTGITRKRAASILFISPETVKFHCKNILSKLKTNKIEIAVSKARDLKIIP